jgi:hypothetical protein
MTEPLHKSAAFTAIGVHPAAAADAASEQERLPKSEERHALSFVTNSTARFRRF